MNLLSVLRRAGAIDTSLVEFLGFWVTPSEGTLLFPRMLSQLQAEFPWTATSLRYLKNQGPILAAMRIHFKGVCTASQLLHSLSPQHLGLHYWSFLGIRTGDLMESEFSSQELSGSVSVRIHQWTGAGVRRTAFNGPLCFTVSTQHNRSIVFLLTPLPDGSGHIGEALSFDASRMMQNTLLPRLLARRCGQVPRVLEDIFKLSYVEDLPYYGSPLSLTMFADRLSRCHTQMVTGNRCPDVLLQGIYRRAFEPHFKSGSFFRMIERSGIIGQQILKSVSR